MCIYECMTYQVRLSALSPKYLVDANVDISDPDYMCIRQHLKYIYMFDGGGNEEGGLYYCGHTTSLLQ